MNRFTASILSAALTASQVSATLGVACVESELVSVFSYINECRTTATCDAATDFNDNVIAGGSPTDFDLRNNFASQAVTITPMTATLTDSNTVMTDLASAITGGNPLEAMTWMEGLASAADEYASAWQADTSLTSLTTSTGTTTTSRAASYGSVTGAITETAYWYTTYTIDPMDMMRLIIMNDGGSNVIASALFATDTDYTTIGMAYKQDSSCSMDMSSMADDTTHCEVCFDVVVAAAYTNASGTTTCNTEISFGGGLCDPDTDGQAVYEAINAMRQQPTLWTQYLDSSSSGSLISDCTTYQCTADFSGDGDATRTYIRGSSNLGDASDAIAAVSGLDALEWTGGLFKAANDHADYLSGQTSLSSTGQGGSTFAERVADYGTAGSLSVEMIQGNTDSATWVVLDMLIDDTDTLNAGRTALLSSAASQAGVAGAENDTFGTVYVAVVDNGYTEDSSTPCVEETVVVEPDTAAGLIVAGTTALATALIIY